MSNPFLTRGLDAVGTGDRPMTLNGTINRTGVLLVICLCAGDYAWTHAVSGGAILGALLGAFIVAMIGIFKAEWTPVMAAVYAVLEGLVLGGIALFYNTKYPGIALNAGLVTVAILFVLPGSISVLGYLSGPDSIKRTLSGLAHSSVYSLVFASNCASHVANVRVA